MSTYKGTALLLFDDDRQVAAEANLRKDGNGTWGGRLAFPSSAWTPELRNLTEGRLRITGRDGRFLVTNAPGVLPAQLYWLEITGNGDAPF